MCQVNFYFYERPWNKMKFLIVSWSPEYEPKVYLTQSKMFLICSYDGEKIYDEERSTHEHRYSRLTSYRGEPFAVGHYHNSGSEHNKVELMTLDSKKWKDMPNYPTHRA